MGRVGWIGISCRIIGIGKKCYVWQYERSILGKIHFHHGIADQLLLYTYQYFAHYKSQDIKSNKESISVDLLLMNLTWIQAPYLSQYICMNEVNLSREWGSKVKRGEI